MILWYNVPNATITHNIPTSIESRISTSVDTAYETITGNSSNIANTSSETLAPYLNNHNENNEDELLANVIDINENEAKKSEEDIDLNNEIDGIDFNVKLENEDYFDEAINDPDYKPIFQRQKPLDTDDNEETNNIRRYPTRERKPPKRYQVNNIRFVTNKETIKRQ